MGFLIRPPPQPGECLSSWRQRLGLENGFRLFPLAPGELRRSDPDLVPRASTLDWVAANTLQPADLIAAMTLRGLHGRLLTIEGSRRHPRWVIPLRYSGEQEGINVPFCPQCLREDKKPYFRLMWRISLTSRCNNHSNLLVDQCPSCRSPVWPGLVCIPGVYDRVWCAPHICPKCQFDLRFAQVTYSSSPDENPLTGDHLPG